MENNVTKKIESLSLKWGTWKSYDLDRDGESAAWEAMERYFDLGAQPVSAMAQHDTPEMKQALCEVVDALNAETVYLSWDGRDVSKDEAKTYILNYGN
jgi:hypothetical protein